MRNFVRYLAVLTAIAALWVLSTTVGNQSANPEATSALAPVASDAPGKGVGGRAWVSGTASSAPVAGGTPGVGLTASSSSRPVASLRPPAGVANKPLIDGPRGPEVADELVVRFAAGLEATAIARVAADAGAEVVWSGARTGAAILRFDDRAAQRRGRSILAAHPGVISVAPNLVMEAASQEISTEELRQVQWHLDALALGDADGGRADGVVVAVLDTGAAYETAGPYAVAPDLAGVDFVAGYDFVNIDEFPNDDQGHGTHITAILAAADGARSVAPGAAVIPVKVLDEENRGTEVALAEGLRFAVDAGAQVVNMSLSFSPGYFPSRLMQDAIAYAVGKGAVLVAAAGNHGGDTVTYPAAFRDVIAVGATSLRRAAQPGGDWGDGSNELERAYYSNSGFLLDVAAPGGDLLADRNGDGNPEAVLAQTFAAGDPTQFGYYFYAGTSQAAAQVSGLVARMLAADPTLSRAEIRQALGATADTPEGQVLTESFGRGVIRGGNALLAATELGVAPDLEQPRFFATMVVSLESVGPQRLAQAEVEVIDEDGVPAAGVRVHGTFSGAIAASDTVLTGIDGRAVFRSPTFDSTGTIVGFQVDAVSTTGANGIVDRPRGFMRIDSLSLEMLASFGLGTSSAAAAPGEGSELDQPDPAVADPTAGDETAANDTSSGETPSDETTPDTNTTDDTTADDASADETATNETPASTGDVEGSGIGTSSYLPVNNGGLAGFGIGSSPIALRFAPELQGTNAVPSVQLTNFGWGLATVPMAVVVDSAWLFSQFPEAELATVTSFGIGLGESPVRFDAVDSFSTPIDLNHYEELPEPQSLLVLTFFGTGSFGVTGGCGIGTSSNRPCAEGAGIGTSAIFSKTILVDHYYSTSPELEIDAVLDSLWSVHTEAEVTGSGIGTSNRGGILQPLVNHLDFMTQRYVSFAGDENASPVGRYGDLLDAARLESGSAEMAPAAASESSEPKKLQ